MKTSEIKEMTISEIAERLDAEKQELSRISLNHHISPLENPMRSDTHVGTLRVC
jgi:large subunit ribosomal protein L29